MEKIRNNKPKKDIELAGNIISYIAYEKNLSIFNVTPLLYVLDMDYYAKKEEQLMGLVYKIDNDKIITDLSSIQVEKNNNLTEEIKEFVDEELSKIVSTTLTSKEILEDIPVVVARESENKEIDFESVFYRK